MYIISYILASSHWQNFRRRLRWRRKRHNDQKAAERQYINEKVDQMDILLDYGSNISVKSIPTETLLNDGSLSFVLSTEFEFDKSLFTELSKDDSSLERIKRKESEMRNVSILKNIFIAYSWSIH